MAVVLLALLAVAAVVVIALPLVREPTSADRMATIDPAVRARLELREERDAALAALADLELDRRTGKIVGEDHAALAGELRARVAAALAALEDPAVAPLPTSDAVEAP